MAEPPQTLLPTGLRWLVVLSRVVWWLVLGFWALMLLATMALHWWIVPRVLDWQPQIEAMASKAWGVQLRIGQLASESNDWVPTFVLSDVVLHDAQQQEVLRLPKVRVSLSPASLLSLKLDQVELEGPSLTVRRDAQGHWQVAGMSLADDGQTDLIDWLLSQPHIQVRQGRLRWVDDMLGQPEVDFASVQLDWRNGLRSHTWQLDLQPPPAWGQPLRVQGDFTQSLFHQRPSDLSTWKGRLYAQLPKMDIAKLSPYLSPWLNMQSIAGEGWLRAWVDVHHGQWLNPVLDMGLQQVKLHFKTQSQAMVFHQLSGRLRMQPWLGGLGDELITEQFQVTPAQGEPWRSGKTRLAWRHPSQPDQPWGVTGELHVEDAPLTVLADVAALLPLDDRMRARLNQAKPQGQVQRLALQWFEAGSPAFHFKAEGKVQHLQLQSSAALPNRKPSDDWWPGVQHAQVNFEFNELAGKAQLQVADGQVHLVDWLEDPVVPITSLNTSVQWAWVKDRLQLRLQNTQVANADAKGSFELLWEEGDQALPLGNLDLQVQLQRVQANRLHRYLPLDMPARDRHYLRDAITSGWFDKASLQIKGPLDHFPFNTTGDGVFLVKAPFQQFGFQYVPPPPVTASTKRPVLIWPAVQQAQGEWQINKAQMQVKSSNARFGTQSALQVTQLEVQVADITQAQAVVDVNARLKGGLTDAVLTLQSSPLAATVGQWFTPTGVSGQAEHQFRVSVPLANPDNTRVQGSVNLLGNDLQLQAPVPRLLKARGQVNYTQNSLAINNVRLTVLGGEARLDGALRFDDTAKDLTPSNARLTLQGTISSDTLRQAPEFNQIAWLASHLQGSTSYTATLGWRQGQPELSVVSDLLGMAVDLPSPLDKPASASWPMRYETTKVRNASPRGSAGLQDQLQFSLGQVLSARYWRDTSGPSPTVLRGWLQLGATNPAKDMPDGNTVAWQIRQPSLNLDDWQPVLNQWMGEDNATQSNSAGRSALASYMPQRIDLQTASLTWSSRSFTQTQVLAERQSRQWRIQAKAQEFQGTADYRPAQDNATAKITAHLQYLIVPPSVVEEVEAVMSESPKDMPALDITIDNLELRGIALGRADVEGFARTNNAGSREWVLNKLNLTMPEATFQSKGQWGGAAKSAAKRSQLEFQLQIQDSGLLLGRLGYKGALKDGKGRMVGQIGWQGSPFTPDYHTMSGQFNVSMERGQFLKSEPGVARLLGVLSLQSLPRRLLLDFRDVFSEGFLFDFVRGDVTIEQGIASTNNLQMKGVSAAVLMEGKADIKNETQDIKVVVIPELNAGTASLVYSAINPVVGLTTFLAQYVLRKPLIKSNTQEFRVQGTWKDPKVHKVDATTDSKPGAAESKP